jgi:hypothetical protein
MNPLGLGSPGRKAKSQEKEEGQHGAKNGLLTGRGDFVRHGRILLQGVEQRARIRKKRPSG